MISSERFVQLARWALWSLTAIVITGASVRLTGSGLGCSDWPNCEEDQFVASLEYHAMIEFVNRLVTGVVAVAVILAVLGSLRRVPRRQDLVRWSLGLVAGVVAQVILGALLVKTELDPRFTMGHFLLSMVLLWNAVVLLEKAKHDGLGAGSGSRLTIWTRLVFVATAVLLVTGTIVTGSGPHSGGDESEVAARLPFLVREVTRIHSITAITVLALVLWTVRRAHCDGEYERREDTMRVMSLLVAQGAVGYWQYFTGVPVLLVGVHIALASLAWIQIVRLAWLTEQPVSAEREAVRT